MCFWSGTSADLFLNLSLAWLCFTCLWKNTATQALMKVCVLTKVGFVCLLIVESGCCCCCCCYCCCCCSCWHSTVRAYFIRTLTFFSQISCDWFSKSCLKQKTFFGLENLFRFSLIITARITFTSILYPQSQCIHVHVIYIIYTCHSPYNGYELNLLLTCLLQQGFVAQLVEHRTVIVKVIGLNIYVCVCTTASVWRWSPIQVLTYLTRLNFRAGLSHIAVLG